MPLCRREEGMARRPALDDRALQFDYRFDRLLPQKLEQVYEVLVPPVRRPIGSVEFDSLQEKVNEQTSCNLCAGFLRPSEGGPHYRQSDNSPGGICEDKRIRGAAGMGLPRQKAKGILQRQRRLLAVC
jgi:hypothetical protein